MAGSRLWSGIAATVLAVGMLTISPSLAAAKGGSAGSHTCSGTLQSPGVLSGSYRGNVSVQGVCAVNAGPADINGNLVVRPGGALLAAFALNDQTHSGSSSLTVKRSIWIQRGGSMVLGCDPQSSPCIDDNQNHPSLSSEGTVGGNINEFHPLGVLVHNTSIAGSVRERHGGGGVTCKPSGIFTAFQSPVFSAYEDSSVGGNVSISGYKSCWLGIARVNIGRNLRLHNNTLADPDAIEVLSNTVGRNLNCRHNSAVWDSSEAGNGLFPRNAEPNTVAGHRLGQCVLATPTTQGGSAGPGPF